MVAVVDPLMVAKIDHNPLMVMVGPLVVRMNPLMVMVVRMNDNPSIVIVGPWVVVRMMYDNLSMGTVGPSVVE